MLVIEVELLNQCNDIGLFELLKQCKKTGVECGVCSQRGVGDDWNSGYRERGAVKNTEVAHVEQVVGVDIPVRDVQVEVDGAVGPISHLAFDGMDDIFELAWGADRFVTNCMFIAVMKRAGLDERRDAGFVAGMMRVSVNMNVDHVKDVIDDGGGVVPVGSVREEEINERNTEGINVVHVDSSLRDNLVFMKGDEEFTDGRVEGTSGHGERLERLERRGESKDGGNVDFAKDENQNYEDVICERFCACDTNVSCIIKGFCVFCKISEVRF